MKDNALFCSALESTTIAVDAMQTLSMFFDQEELRWKNLGGVCSDGAPAMLGARSSLQTLVRNPSPDAVSMHCMIHKQDLASKTLPASLQDALNPWWASYFIKVTDLQLHGKKVTKLQLPFSKVTSLS